MLAAKENSVCGDFALQFGEWMKNDSGKVFEIPGVNNYRGLIPIDELTPIVVTLAILSKNSMSQNLEGDRLKGQADSEVFE